MTRQLEFYKAYIDVSLIASSLPNIAYIEMYAKCNDKYMFTEMKQQMNLQTFYSLGSQSSICNTHIHNTCTL